MLTVDCRDVLAIKTELAVYVSDQIAAIPSLKINEFMLAPIDDESLDHELAIVAIKEFLDSIGESHNFAVISSNNLIQIKSISGKEIVRDPSPPGEMFSCSHCGFVTRYEVEHQNHMKIHYL